MSDMLGLLTQYSDQILIGLIGGAAGGGIAELTRYIHGWYQAGHHRGADFHIAATMYTPIDLQPGAPPLQGGSRQWQNPRTGIDLAGPGGGT